MLRRTRFIVRQVLKLHEKLIALPNVFQEQIKDRRRWGFDAAVLDAVAGADMAQLQAALNAGFMTRRDSREREKARRQGNFVAVGKFCPGVREIEIVA
jgi:hypothetical protein